MSDHHWRHVQQCWQKLSLCISCYHELEGVLSGYHFTSKILNDHLMDALFSMNSRQCYSSLCHGQGAPKPVYLIKQHIGANGRKKAWGSNPPDRSCCWKSTKSIHSSSASNSTATLSAMASMGDSPDIDWLGSSTSALGPVGAPASSWSSQGPKVSSWSSQNHSRVRKSHPEA